MIDSHSPSLETRELLWPDEAGCEAFARALAARPGIGQAFIVIDPGALAGSDGFFDRIEVLLAEMLQDDGVRLPGARREALRCRAEADGLEVADALVQPWTNMTS